VLGLLAGAVLIAGCGGGDGAEAPNAGFTPPRISSGDLHRCHLQPAAPGFRCGELELPLERADRGLGTTTVAFAVRPPSDRPASEGAPIFAVEGGPGYGSTGTSKAYVSLFGDLLDRHALVLVDQRGTGLSDPIDCPRLQTNDAPEWIEMADCARRLGLRFDSYRTAAAADDLDSVREALGYDKLALYGDSYGTFLAQSYAYRHPHTLAAIVLDSAYPTFGESAWYPNLPRTAIRAMDVACRRDPSCQGDAGGRLERLARYLRRTRRGVGDLLDALIDAAYGPPETFRDIDVAGAALVAGDPEPWRRLTRDDRIGYGDPRSYSHAAEVVYSCNDYPMIWDKDATETERLAQLNQAIRRYPKGTFGPFTPREVAESSNIGYLYCLTAPRPGPDYEPPADRQAKPTDAPVLVVSGELDSVTTAHEGDRVADQFPHARQYIVRDAGHVDALYHPNGPAAVHIRRFLRENLNDQR
jgi:pimeloyl-ACP methyl ester carboxylesterase